MFVSFLRHHAATVKKIRSLNMYFVLCIVCWIVSLWSINSFEFWIFHVPICYDFREISRQKMLRLGRFIILNDSASPKMVITSIAACIKNPFRKTSEHNHRYDYLNFPFFHEKKSLLLLSNSFFFIKTDSLIDNLIIYKVTEIWQ